MSAPMGPLAGLVCTPCRGGEPQASPEEITGWAAQLPGWSVVERAGVRRLEKSFSFKDFALALAFTNRVAAQAEKAGHHPALLTEWGRVTVTWWTHKLKGLHRNDFIMAARTDAQEA